MWSIDARSTTHRTTTITTQDNEISTRTHVFTVSLVNVSTATTGQTDRQTAREWVPCWCCVCWPWLWWSRVSSISWSLSMYLIASSITVNCTTSQPLQRSNSLFAACTYSYSWPTINILHKYVKPSHTGYRALGPELIRCTGSQPAGDYKSSTRL